MSAALAGESSCWRQWATKKGTGREDIHLLPLLLAAAHRSHKSGAFLEIGALDGVEASQTMLLEKCYHWPGLLVEGAPRDARERGDAAGEEEPHRRALARALVDHRHERLGECDRPVVAASLMPSAPPPDANVTAACDASSGAAYAAFSAAKRTAPATLTKALAGG